MLSLAEARGRILQEARPSEAIEVALSEALGLVLAEPLTADVDLPPFDRASVDGYAVRAADAEAGARLSAVGRRGGGGAESKNRGPKPGAITLGPGEAAHVATGDPLPVGADAVLRTEDSRPDPGVGPPREVFALRGVSAGQGVVSRGFYLNAGGLIAPAGTRLRLPMVSLLAAQGCIHPVCHRRVRVAVLAVGDHLVGAGEAPVMDRERNAAGPTVVLPCLQRGATAHDLGTVSRRDLTAALARALTASVVVVLGEFEGAIPRALKASGVEPIFSGVSLHPGKRVGYGVVRDDSGAAAHHVFHMSPGPVGVLTVVTLLIGPLIERLHGGPLDALRPLRALWQGAPHRPTDDRDWAVPVTLSCGDDARLFATPISHRGKDDLPGYSHADALALLPPRSGPWESGAPVAVVPLGPWPANG